MRSQTTCFSLYEKLVVVLDEDFASVSQHREGKDRRKIVYLHLLSDGMLSSSLVEAVLHDGVS